MNETFNLGKELGRKHFATIAAKGGRWKSRFIPAWIRDFMFVPYYIVEQEGVAELHVIHLPLGNGGRVHFTVYARAEIDEKERTQIRAGQE